ncbi:GNAT family N-acetyltransferase [Paenibacillus silviterrae]|uniref:GNAT family N-acetyltransferase n=1 Tax=Paenibacillus silviterrae TaxID=3242194 RepID=UPI002542BD2B|nr:GNAT family N-acetyltransferase [Paenibacillus chinjuensis]
MLLDIKSRMQEESVLELMEYAVLADSGELEQVTAEYREDESLGLFGYVEEEDTIGVIGFRKTGDELRIKHMAVQPEYRGMGYGRGLLLELMLLTKPEKVVCEAYADAVDFYRNLGFEVIAIDEGPGGERFVCTYEVHAEEEE